MPSKRSFFAIGAFSSRGYIAGGHDKNKNTLESARGEVAWTLCEFTEYFHPIEHLDDSCNSYLLESDGKLFAVFELNQIEPSIQIYSLNLSSIETKMK
uniref:Uncharacterized protein n=1 Tax=Quercus lobata TaxID=97700 RepID=A0A7N2M6W9_QUELO